MTISGIRQQASDGESNELRARIGFDAGTQDLESAIAWSILHGIKFIDINCDIGSNHIDNWDDGRIENVADLLADNNIHVGIHTLSAVNIAEFSPRMSEAVDGYLAANIELGARLGAEWITVHAGMHFTTELEARRKASIDHLKRATILAEALGQQLLLENLNFEPDDAEVHYLAHTVEECHWYFDAIKKDAFGWAFTANHANLVPDGVDGFLKAFGVDRIGCVRLADNVGTVEVHMIPGEGNIDFKSMFHRLEGAGYGGHYTMAYGTPVQKLESRDWLVEQAGQ
ncbi:MAG: sugar phosphate isomerase/epimerase [Chloroflexi bacterium]|nr:sugar phosphate isomerase/epimerase [Chloroflexota bacterium]